MFDENAVAEGDDVEEEKPKKKKAKKEAETNFLPGNRYRILEKCWAGGAGHLAVGDTARINAKKAKELMDEGKIEPI